MIKNQLEKRAIQATNLEFRELDNGGTLITGFIPYNKQSEEMYGFKEVLAPGAFGESVTGDIRCLWNHDTSKPLGRTKNNTLRFRDTPEGLYFECELPETSWGKDAREAIRRGDVTGVSFGFITQKDDWAYNREDESTIRTITQAELIEVSPVTFPAYPDSLAEARSELLTEGKKRALENMPLPLEIYERRLNLMLKTEGV